MLPKSYRELILLPTIEDRFNYLKIGGEVGAETFGFDRYLNQRFYTSTEWKQFRNKIIARDEGCDLGVKDFPIRGKVIVHHICPLTLDDVEKQTNAMLDPNNAICVSHRMHQAIHYGDISLVPKGLIERTKNDTCPWR